MLRESRGNVKKAIRKGNSDPTHKYLKMKPIVDILELRVSQTMARITGAGIENPSALVKPTQDIRFGDYQVNGVMALAKKLKTNPRQLAQEIVSDLDLSDMCETPEVAGPGFINLRLKADWVSERLVEAITDDDRLGIDSQENPPVTVIDFSSPNLAKEMHVGHLRSTIIGDVMARVLEFWCNDPNKVVRQNHVGDWGLQFGMLVAYLKEAHPQAIADPSCFHISDLEEFYRSAKKLFDQDEVFKNKSYQETVSLHQHDPDSIKAWQYVVAESRSHCLALYRQLDVHLAEEHERGESCYSDKLSAVVSDLGQMGLIQESDGAQCVFLDGFKTKEKEPLPLIVQKSDGAYLYATTDLAAIRYRIGQLKARRIIYVTDARQKLHFEMVFAGARKAGWADENVKLEHVPFGSVLGDDGKPFKTRSGENVKLKSLLDEAENRARKIVEEKNPDLDESTRRKVAHAVGVGAVKYADLSNNLVSDYVFDWDKMLAMEGNTAPYMQYAYARIQSIFRRGAVRLDQLVKPGLTLILTESAELALAKSLLRYAEVLECVVRDLRPHLLTTYLFELAQAFSNFYNTCPVLKAESAIQSSRLLLCYHTAQTIRHGLNLLGIDTIEQM